MTLKHALLAAAGNTGPAPTPADPQFNYVSLLLHGDGTNGAQNNTFTASPTLAPAGGFLAGYFDGDGDYLQTPTNTALNFSSVDYTVEAWVYLSMGTYSSYDQAGRGIASDYLSNSFGRWILYVDTSGKLGCAEQDASGQNSASISDTANMPLNQWVHTAICKSGTTLYLFKDGALVGTTTSAVRTSFGGRLNIGQSTIDPSYRGYFLGYIANVRAVKGTAVYTSNFTPPTAPLTAISGTSLLTCMSGTGVTFADLSSNNFTITANGNATMTGVATTPPGAVPYAGYFDGSGDYLTLPAGAATQFGTGDFTVETWVNFSNASGNACYFFDNRNASQGGTWAFFRNNTDGLEWYTGVTSIVGSTTLPPNQWIHVAYCRSGSTGRLFVNGAQVGSASDTTNYSVSSTIAYIGSRYSAQEQLLGYLSNFRVVKGTALYTANFAPPSSPLTAISGTSLLTCQSATFIDNSPNAFTITPVGNAAVTSSYILPAITRNGNTTQGSLSPYGNLWSNYFDGTGDYLTVGGGMPSGQGTEFTLEFWVYAIGSKVHTFTEGSSGGTLDFYVESTGNIKLDNTGTASIIATANNVFTFNTWVHIALTRTTGNLYTIYVNGVSVGTGTSSISMTANTTIGWHRTTSAYYLLGYISNWRVTNTRVYTANFTPPTAPLTAISGTSLLTCQSNRFIDNSANNFTITRNGDVRVTKESPFLPTAAYSTSAIGGSGYFDGNGDYLTAPVNTAINPGTGDFCFESWAYFTALNTGNIFNGQQNNIGLALDSSNKISIGQSYVSTLLTDPDAATTGQWYHIVVCRSGTTLSLFVNGIRKATTTNSTNFATSSANYIGWNGVSAYFSGYLADIRLVKGSSVYNPASTTLTVPTAPLTAITNTSLLLNFTNAGIFDNAAKNDLETVGNAQISTSVKKFGTGSLAFDGSGDGLILGPSPSLNFGSGYFTLEFWVYFNTVSGTQIVLSTVNGSSNYAYEISCVNGALKHSWSSNGTSWDIVNAGGIGTVAAGTWYHVSICRNQTGGFMADLDGVPDYTWTSTASVFANSGLAIGNNMSLGTSGLNGYIDDLRITKGFPRYTTYYFTPPSAPFPDR